MRCSVNILKNVLIVSGWWSNEQSRLDYTLISFWWIVGSQTTNAQKHVNSKLWPYCYCKIYDFNGIEYSISGLRSKLKSKNITNVIEKFYVKIKSGIPVRLIIIKCWNMLKEWRALVHTDSNVEAVEVVRIYGWGEILKFSLKQPNFLSWVQSNSKDKVSIWQTVIQVLYLYGILLQWVNKQLSNYRLIGGSYYKFYTGYASRFYWCLKITFGIVWRNQINQI